LGYYIQAFKACLFNLFPTTACLFIACPFRAYPSEAYPFKACPFITYPFITYPFMGSGNYSCSFKE
jgi:hypothetical protein